MKKFFCLLLVVSFSLVSGFGQQVDQEAKVDRLYQMVKSGQHKGRMMIWEKMVNDNDFDVSVRQEACVNLTFVYFILQDDEKVIEYGEKAVSFKDVGGFYKQTIHFALANAYLSESHLNLKKAVVNLRLTAEIADQACGLLLPVPVRCCRWQRVGAGGALPPA